VATTSGFAELPLYRKLALGGAVLLFIDLFLPWLSISVEELDISASANAWDSGLGTFIGILLIVLIGWEVLRLVGNAPSFGVEHDVVTAVLAGVIAVLTLFLFVDVLGDTGIGAWLGIVLLIALGYAAYLAFTAGADREAVTGSPDRAPHTAPETVPPPVAEPDVPPAPSSSPAPDVADPDTVPEQRPDDPRREQPPAL
jgi:hypothetical protein